MVTYLGGSILITIFALGGSIVSYNSGSIVSYNLQKSFHGIFGIADKVIILYHIKI